MQIWPIIVLVLLISVFPGKERLRVFRIIPHITFNSGFKTWWGEIHMGNVKNLTFFCDLAESLKSLRDSICFSSNHYTLLWKHFGGDNWKYFSVLCRSEILAWPWILLNIDIDILLNIDIEIESPLGRVKAAVVTWFLNKVPGYASTLIYLLIIFYHTKPMPGNSKTRKIKILSTLNCCLLAEVMERMSESPV